MSTGNPLLVEAWRGLVGSNDARLRYFGYLIVQTLVLAAWWPWGDVQRLVVSQTEPNALLAVVMTLGACLAFHGARAGAEEFLLPGQNPLREWLAVPRLGVTRILAGHLAAHLLQTCYVTLLSLPLVVIAFAVSSAEAADLAWALAAAMLASVFFRLAGTLIYLLFGHQASATFVSLRMVVIASYAITALALPAASHPMLAHALLVDGDPTRLALAGIPAPLVFVAVHGLAIALLVTLLHVLLSRQRVQATATPAATAHAVPRRGS